MIFWATETSVTIMYLNFSRYKIVTAIFFKRERERGHDFIYFRTVP